MVSGQNGKIDAIKQDALWRYGCPAGMDVLLAWMSCWQPLPFK
jgi:hypothetical protein